MKKNLRTEDQARKSEREEQKGRGTLRSTRLIVIVGEDTQKSFLL